MFKKTSLLLALGLSVGALFAAYDGRDDGARDASRSAAPGGAIQGGLIASALAQAGAVPLADAGLDRTAGLGDLVVLDGSGSRDPQTGKLLDFAWSFLELPSGSLAALDDPAAVKPSFSPDLPGDYRLQLVVSRQGQTSLPDEVTISTENAAPVAKPGADREVLLGETLQLDASRFLRHGRRQPDLCLGLDPGAGRQCRRHLRPGRAAPEPLHRRGGRLRGGAHGERRHGGLRPGQHPLFPPTS